MDFRAHLFRRYVPIVFSSSMLVVFVALIYYFGFARGGTSPEEQRPLTDRAPTTAKAFKPYRAKSGSDGWAAMPPALTDPNSQSWREPEMGPWLQPEEHDEINENSENSLISDSPRRDAFAMPLTSESTSSPDEGASARGDLPRPNPVEPLGAQPAEQAGAETTSPAETPYRDPIHRAYLGPRLWMAEPDPNEVAAVERELAQPSPFPAMQDQAEINRRGFAETKARVALCVDQLWQQFPAAQGDVVVIGQWQATQGQAYLTGVQLKITHELRQPELEYCIRDTLSRMVLATDRDLVFDVQIPMRFQP